MRAKLKIPYTVEIPKQTVYTTPDDANDLIDFLEESTNNGEDPIESEEQLKDAILDFYFEDEFIANGVYEHITSLHPNSETNYQTDDIEIINIDEFINRYKYLIKEPKKSTCCSKYKTGKFCPECGKRLSETQDTIISQGSWSSKPKIDMI